MILLFLPNVGHLITDAFNFARHDVGNVCLRNFCTHQKTAMMDDLSCNLERICGRSKVFKKIANVKNLSTCQWIFIKNVLPNC